MFAPSLITTADLVTIATSARHFLEPCWLTAHQSWEDGIPTPLSCWMCRYSSLFLTHVLLEHKLPCQIVAGRPQQSANGGSDAGIWANGIWNDHCWVHCWLEHQQFILDVTADQFGYDPVIVSDALDQRYQANLSEQDMAPALAKLSRRPLAWFAAWIGIEPPTLTTRSHHPRYPLQ